MGGASYDGMASMSAAVSGMWFCLGEADVVVRSVCCDGVRLSEEALVAGHGDDGIASVGYCGASSGGVPDKGWVSAMGICVLETSKGLEG